MLTLVTAAAALCSSALLLPSRISPRTVVSMLAETSGGFGNPDVDKRKEIAKARRAVASQGKGGLQKRAGARRSEQKAPAAGKGFGAAPGLNFDRRPKASAACGCGSGIPYSECCGAAHDGADAADPASLVRARYTAYLYRLPDFLMRTTDPEGTEYDADAAAWKRGLLGFCDDFEFQGLQLGKTNMFGENEATVDFRVNFCQKGTFNLMTLVEKSSFFRDASGRWLYANGEVSYESQS
eukprot:CAMPEP_0174721398 /NCGR_PEP_ID=MMETSP1094-20130205/36106_1 /TAXON_ID=156173 /ORGANISM="Chrysochromulina brevifilum, Strain UTEX LB 985" /LENGTH=238 /DNA_ID=CAMNT_0015922079 /DNA_START=240 /DNA_END=956 /DNA_ORIENTATION=-